MPPFPRPDDRGGIRGAGSYSQAGAPGSFQLPPAKGKKQQSSQAVYRSYVNSHKALKPYAELIYRWATYYGVDPVHFASLIMFESGGKPKVVSSAGAIGLGQIHAATWVGKPVPWMPGRTITQADLRNPAFNVRFAAYYFSQQLAKHGTYDAAYRQGYNPGYTGSGPFRDLPKNYVPTGTSKSPQEQAERSVEAAAAKQAIADPWITFDKNGRLKLVYSLEPPKNVLRFGGKNGVPVTQGSFFQQWKNRLDPIFIAYTGKRATAQQAADALRRGISDYGLQTSLAKTPQFFNSPVWKQYAPNYKSIIRKMFGEDRYDADTMRSWVAEAILHNWDGEAFASALRQKKEYLTSNEFKQGALAFTQVYQSIYGTPDANATVTVQEAVRAGWTPDQFAGYLRQQPAYKFSPEYQGKALNFFERLGLVFPGMPTLGPGGPPPQMISGTPPPNSQLVPGAPGPVAPGNTFEVNA